jgi:hypothetical protein
MPLGVRPTVDFAFKKIFGSPQNSLALIGLLNAILDLRRPIEAVEILNPFSYHTIELTKYHLSESTITTASKLHQWVFLLLNAQQYDAPQLKALLPGIEFDQAIDTLATISAKSEDRQMYDQREKAQRDYEWALSGAHEEGREQGRREGKLAGNIQLLQDLLGDPMSGDADLLGQTPEELKSQLAILQQRLRDRTA